MVVVNEGTTEKIAQMELDRQAASSSSESEEEEEEEEEEDVPVAQPRLSLAALQRGSSKLLTSPRFGFRSSPRTSYDVNASSAPVERPQASLMAINKGPSKPKLNVTPRDKVKVEVRHNKAWHRSAQPRLTLLVQDLWIKPGFGRLLLRAQDPSIDIVLHCKLGGESLQ